MIENIKNKSTSPEETKENPLKRKAEVDLTTVVGISQEKSTPSKKIYNEKAKSTGNSLSPKSVKSNFSEKTPNNEKIVQNENIEGFSKPIQEEKDSENEEKQPVLIEKSIETPENDVSKKETENVALVINTRN